MKESKKKKSKNYYRAIIVLIMLMQQIARSITWSMNSSITNTRNEAVSLFDPSIILSKAHAYQ